MSVTCSGCGKGHAEVRVMVALSKGINICNECVEICSEIVCEDSGFVMVTKSEIDELRVLLEKTTAARIWIESVREAVEQADATFNGTKRIA